MAKMEKGGTFLIHWKGKGQDRKEDGALPEKISSADQQLEPLALIAWLLKAS